MLVYDEKYTFARRLEFSRYQHTGIHVKINHLSITIHVHIISSQMKYYRWQPFNPFPNKLWFLHVCSTSLLKIPWEKEKLLITSNFSFSPRFFYPFWRTVCHFNQIKNFRLQTLSVWKSLQFVVWERVKKEWVMPAFIPLKK